MKETIINKVTTFITNDVINNEAITINPDDNIITGGYVDSLGIIRIMSHIQECYGIKGIDKKDMIMDNFLTVNRISDLILKYTVAS